MARNTKTLRRWALIYDALLTHRCERNTPLIALGGGVVGDMTGFAAATYLRGVPFIQIPTTLLAQVDSSVGGKTGINHPLGKNMIGAFYQPQLVLADIATLDTLPDQELSAGIAEVIKYGLIRDLPFFEWLEPNMEKLLARDADALQYAITRSCRNKAEVVGADERESGERALLNLGHTFGHAIETGMGYGVWLHGEGVAAGTLMAADLSRRLGWISAAGCGAHPQPVRARQAAGGCTYAGRGKISATDGAGQKSGRRQDALRAAQGHGQCRGEWRSAARTCCGKRLRGMQRQWLNSPPMRSANATRAAEPCMRTRRSGAANSSATATASSIPPRSAAWNTRPRYSSTMKATCFAPA